MIALPVVMALRVVAVFMFAAGTGSLTAATLSRSLVNSDAFPAAASLPGFALALAVLFLSASVGAFLLMPAQTALVREIRGEPDPALPSPLMFLLIALCALAALQVPGLAGWWEDDRAFLRRVLPGERDRLGFDYIPAAILFSMPALATVTLSSFVLISLLTAVAPAKLAPRVLAAGVLMQVGLVVGALVLAREVHTIGTAVLQAVAEPSQPASASGVPEWFARHGVSAATTYQRLAWTCGGYLVALAYAVLFAPRAPVRTEHLTTTDPRPGAFQPDVVTVQRAPAFAVSPASGAFDDSNYSVRARMTMIESLFIRRHAHYDIRTIPPSSRGQFSFSWTTGALRREPNGPDSLIVAPPQAPGLFTGRSYAVLDAATGAPVATLTPSGADWEIVHPSGGTIARVLRSAAGAGSARYEAMIGDDLVCRFKWALHGLTVASAELEVEFARGQNAALDRAVAMVIAPILEQQARLVSERSRS